MAVPFYVPEQDDRGSSASSANSSVNNSPNTTTSATQTPIPSPVSGEHLVQAFCEALYRCSMNGSSSLQFSPSSPSCSSANSNSSNYHGGEIFFPNARSSIPRSPRVTSSSDDRVFFRQTPSNRHTLDLPRRTRLASTGDDDIECYSEHETSWDELDERFENYMVARERLQEFPGRIPPRKRKKETHKSKTKPKEQQCFTWPTVVTVFVFAVGCGFLVTR